ncbi:MAG: hypothetical protein ACPGXL_03455 [Chitinophagales bacterium]
MQDQNKSMFDQLREILLQEERQNSSAIQKEVSEIKEEVTAIQEEVSGIKDELSDIKEELSDEGKFEERLDPLIEHKLSRLKSQFHDIFGHEVKESVKREFVQSREEFVEVIYPIMGKMVQKYVKMQMGLLLEKLGETTDNAFSVDWWKGKARRLFKSKTQRQKENLELVLAPEIVDILYIHRESGLLIGCHSPQNTADVDMVAGMLTAIKSFVEDALKHTNVLLETIEYSGYQILIDNFHRYYVATVVSGNPTTEFRAKLYDHLLEFDENHVPDVIETVEDQLFERISAQLKIHINNLSLVSDRN